MPSRSGGRGVEGEDVEVQHEVSLGYLFPNEQLVQPTLTSPDGLQAASRVSTRVLAVDFLSAFPSLQMLLFFRAVAVENGLGLDGSGSGIG
ncbi:unnamed protein product [Sphagnum tenellum]